MRVSSGKFIVNREVLERLSSRLRIGIVCAGSPDCGDTVIHKTHNPRGWKSYRSGAEDIGNALRRRGYKYVEILQEGKDLAEQIESLSIELAWLNSGGVQGYDGMCHAAAMLESLGVPYVGHRPAQTTLMDNKHFFKMFLQGMGLPTAPFMSWDARYSSKKIIESDEFKRNLSTHSGAYIVKPVSGRASNNIIVVDSMDDLENCILRLNEVTDNLALVETFLPGREFCVAATRLDFLHENGFAKGDQTGVSSCGFSHLERILSDDEKIFTSMDIRPISVDRVKGLDQYTDKNLIAKLNAVAGKVYYALGLNTMVRADLRQDQNGVINVLEFNPKPDIRKGYDSSTSLISLGLKASGFTYDDLILNELANSLERQINYCGKSMHNILQTLVDDGMQQVI